MASEYDWMKTEMEDLASHLEELDDCAVDADQVAGILRCLLDGWSAPSIIEEYELTKDGDV